MSRLAARPWICSSGVNRIRLPVAFLLCSPTELNNITGTNFVQSGFVIGNRCLHIHFALDRCRQYFLACANGNWRTHESDRQKNGLSLLTPGQNSPRCHDRDRAPIASPWSHIQKPCCDDTSVKFGSLCPSATNYGQIRGRSVRCPECLMTAFVPEKRIVVSARPINKSIERYSHVIRHQMLC